MKKLKGVILVGVIIIFLGGGYKLVQHEKMQDELILQLQTELNDIYNLRADLKNINYLDTGINYLAIGNSITKHKENEYWWDEHGMAASTKEKDYVHLIAAYLREEGEEVLFYTYNFYQWEVQSTDRAEMLELIDPYMNSELDIITVQLGENVTDTRTYYEDYKELINYIKRGSPNAIIIIIDDFWSDREKSVIKSRVAMETNVYFVDLSDIRGDEEYQCGIGTVVYDSEGIEHMVEHEGVARHPGDKGMEVIANRVIDILKHSLF